jgi:hypothetical protein
MTKTTTIARAMRALRTTRYDPRRVKRAVNVLRKVCAATRRGEPGAPPERRSQWSRLARALCEQHYGTGARPAKQYEAGYQAFYAGVRATAKLNPDWQRGWLDAKRDKLDD